MDFASVAIFGQAALTSGKGIDCFDATTFSPFSTSKSYTNILAYPLGSSALVLLLIFSKGLGRLASRFPVDLFLCPLPQDERFLTESIKPAGTICSCEHAYLTLVRRPPSLQP